MKILKYLLMIFLICPVIASGQSSIDIDSAANIDVGLGADICADMQTGDGTITGAGTFCGGVLPVELISFISTINRRNVTLNGTTATESNNFGFEIERSVVNPKFPGWSKVGFAPVNGTTISPRVYSFTDIGLNSGRYNYRLKQIDFNGNFSYYNLINEVQIGVPEKSDLLQNYPNPSNPTSKIDYQLSFDDKVLIKLYDLLGRDDQP